jgi:hypothetical protein
MVYCKRVRHKFHTDTVPWWTERQPNARSVSLTSWRTVSEMEGTSCGTGTTTANKCKQQGTVIGRYEACRIEYSVPMDASPGGDEVPDRDGIALAPNEMTWK